MDMNGHHTTPKHVAQGVIKAEIIKLIQRLWSSPGTENWDTYVVVSKTNRSFFSNVNGHLQSWNITKGSHCCPLFQGSLRKLSTTDSINLQGKMGSCPLFNGFQKKKNYQRRDPVVQNFAGDI